jgi:hypothetical protein
MNTKKYHMIIGTLLVLFGVVCTTISVFIYLKPEIQPDLNGLINAKTQECYNLAVSSGFNVETVKTGNIIMNLKITAKEPDILNNPMPVVYKSSLLISKCNNLKIKNYCLGQDCIQDYQTSFILSFDRPKL